MKRINDLRQVWNSNFKFQLFLLSTICLLFIHPLKAQQEQIEVEDVVYLKDGSIYRGLVIEETDLHLYMVILDGQTIDIPQKEIRRILSSDRYIFHKRGRFHHTKGFFWGLNFGFSPQPNEESEHVSILLGYRFNKKLSLALGFGSEFTTSPVGGFEVETFFNSSYLYGRYYLTDARRRPFVYGRVGYGAGPENEDVNNIRHSGGLQGQMGAGIHFASRKKSKFIISLGYHAQHTSGKQFYLDGFGNEVVVDFENLIVNHLVFKFGVEFR